MQVILDHQYDLGQPVYMINPSNKFWEVNLNGRTVTFRVGKLRNGQESGEEEVSKDYPSPAAARTTTIQKIKDKLTKGYICKEAKKIDKPQIQQKPQPEVRAGGGRDFTGQYYEKGKEGIKLQVNNEKVKITRIDESKKEGFEVRSFKTNKDAVQYCLGEEQYLKGSGWKAMSHKFLYSFVVDEEQEQPARGRRAPKPKSVAAGKSNVLSITEMTDDAISHRSRNTSSAHSDRSYVDDGGSDNKYLDSKSRLGAPTSGCIKVLLAETFKEEFDPQGWLMSEKLDGVRCFWTGSTMYSRNGNRFFFPKFFTRGWPNSQLDGELFIGRGRFSETLSAVKKNTPIDQQWQKVRYLVFDCPGLKKPFKQRIKAMEEVIGGIDNPYIKCHAHRPCEGFKDLFEQLDKVNKIEGEGLMLRDPESFYENRRSSTLMKVKTFHDDEAVVLGYKPGTGRCHGMVGALKVKNTHGVEFEVGSGLTDAQRRRPPKIGSKITYKYQEFNKDSGKPRFPTFMRAFDDSI